MADKRIDELEEALSITANDLFVLEQASTAKKLTGQTMTNFLLSLANGHGGISTIAKTSSSGTNPVVDTYTITFADNSTSTFQITNGVKGDTGAQGPQGPDGNDITITSSTVDYQAWTSGTSYPTGTWVTNPPAVSQGSYLWTRVIVNYSDGNQTVAYSVARMGVDGNGAVSTVNNVSPDGNGNVALTASDVGALADSYQPPVTSVNTKTGDVVLDNADVNAPYGKGVSATLSSAGWYRVLTYAASSANDASGYKGAVLHMDVTRGYTNAANEAHGIDLDLVYGKIAFIGEKSVTNSQLIDKVRYNTNGANGYVDIHYTGASANSVTACFSVAADPTEQAKFTAGTLAAVADAPAGETVRTTYEFASNTSIVDVVSSGSVRHSYRRSGNVVVIGMQSLGGTSLTQNATTTVATLPVGLRPLETINFAADNTGGTISIGGMVQPNGDVDLYATNASTSYWRFSVSYIV